MTKQPLTFQEKEVLQDKARKKLQALLNYGFEIYSSNGTKENLVNSIVKDLEDNWQFTLTVPKDMCICLKVSNMVLKLLKPYLKDLLHIEQKTTKTHYLLFNYDDEETVELLKPLIIDNNEQIQLSGTFELVFDKYSLPSYTNKAKLYSVSMAPTLTRKEIKKILQIHQKIVDNTDNYFLLSNNVALTYNMPMTLLRLLGENVVSLNTLNCLEIILIFASNSSAIYRQPEDSMKPFVIPKSFFNIDDFELDISESEIYLGLKSLKAIGLINYFEAVDNVYIIESNIITKSIKQYSYKQAVGYYRGLELHQQYYVYTFINLIRYIKNIKHVIEKKDLAGETFKATVKADKLTIRFDGLIYNLELEDYLHDHARLADILTVLQKVGIQQKLLVRPADYKSISKDTIKYLLSHRDNLHEYFILNTKDETPETLQSFSNYDASCVDGRSYLKNIKRRYLNGNL